MSVLLQFRVRGSPVGQPRPRATAFAGRARMYEQTRTADGRQHPIVGWRQAVAQAARAALQDRIPITCPVVVSALFLLPRPARLIWKRRPMPREPHAGKPDLDNLIKAILDSLSPKRGAGAWLDDAQVCGLLRVESAYCEAGWSATGELVSEPAGALVQILAAADHGVRWEESVRWEEVPFS